MKTTLLLINFVLFALLGYFYKKEIKYIPPSPLPKGEYYKANKRTLEDSLGIEFEPFIQNIKMQKNRFSYKKYGYGNNFIYKVTGNLKEKSHKCVLYFYVSKEGEILDASAEGNYCFDRDKPNWLPPGCAQEECYS